jgi:hypothetical protein
MLICENNIIQNIVGMVHWVSLENLKSLSHLLQVKLGGFDTMMGDFDVDVLEEIHIKIQNTPA